MIDYMQNQILAFDQGGRCEALQRLSESVILHFGQAIKAVKESLA